MPRTGWVALGAIAAALVVEAAGLSGVRALAVALAALAAAVAASAAARAWTHSPTGRRVPALVAIGAALVFARATLGAGPETDAFVAPAADQARRATVLTVYAPANGMQRAILALLVDGSADAPGPGARVYASLPRYPAIAPGDVVEFDGRLQPAPPATESGFAEFLARSGIAFTTRSHALSVARTPETPAAALEGVRRVAGDLITRSLPEPQGGLAAALVIGLRDLVARDVAADFRTAGLSHVVAISGYHMAMLAAVASAALRPLARRPRSAALLAVLVGYSLLAGASASVLRASAMTGTVLVLRILGRAGQAAAALASAVVLLLVAYPATVADVGFQLSVAATAGLLRWASPFSDALRTRLPAATPGWLVEALGVSLAAQLATLPLVLLHFGRLSLVAPLANLLAVPLVAPAMASAGVGLIAGGATESGLPALLLAPLQLAAAVTIGALIAVARTCAALPMASVELAPPLDLAGAAAALAVLLYLLRREPKRAAAAESRRVEPTVAGRGWPRAAGALAGAVVLAGVFAAGALPDGRLHMTVLDVGQGDAILLVGARGSRMLVDTGPDPDRLVALLDARLPAWDRRLDLVVITHPHEDHVAGLALLLDRYRIAAIAEPGMIGLGPGDAAFRQRLSEQGRTTRLLVAGDSFDLDGARISVRWPLAGRVAARATSGGKEVNNVSIVLDIAFGQRRLVLTGDVEEEVDLPLLEGSLGAPGPPIDVLKVAHHGSATATTDTFVERLRPRLAVISAGVGNPYGHPSPGTVARLEAAGAEVMRTDQHGSVHIATDGRDLQVSTTGGRPPAVRAEAPWPAIGPGFCPIPGAPTEARAPPYNRLNGRPQPTAGTRPAPRPASL
jgi:competence protein ComEC